MSSCSTPWWAEYVSWQTAERRPRILLIATLAPDARPADEDAAVRLASLDGEPEPLREVGVVVARIGPVAAEVDQVVAETGGVQPSQQLVLEPGTGVVGSEGDAHQAAWRRRREPPMAASSASAVTTASAPRSRAVPTMRASGRGILRP